MSDRAVVCVTATFGEDRLLDYMNDWIQGDGLTNAILFFSQRRKDRQAWAVLGEKSNWAKLRQDLQAAETFERLAQIIKDLPNWRTERAVRRVARRGALLDCRKRARHASEMKRRRKTIAKWWRASLCSGLLATRSVVIPTRLKGFPDSDGWVQVIDDRLPEPMPMPDRGAHGLPVLMHPDRIEKVQVPE